jgi:UDP-N-acetylglucosamine 2-epimerase
LPDTDKRMISVPSHRRQNVGLGILNACAALRTLAIERDDIHIVDRELADVPNTTLLPPLGCLMKRNYLVFSDSGGI